MTGHAPVQQLSRRQRALVELAAAMGRPGPLGAALEDALTSAAPAEVEEVILQGHLFVGYPATLEGLAELRRTAEGDVPAGSVVEGPGAGAGRAEAVLAQVYGGRTELVREAVRALHPDLEVWMVHDGYGRVLGRPGLDLETRELCIVALLAVAGHPRQLHSHLFGALNAGAPAGAVADALEVGLQGVGPDWDCRARAIWAEVSARSGVAG